MQNTMKTLVFSKEIKKRQKHFPWLKIFSKNLLKSFPHYKETLKYLVDNVEKELKNLSVDDHSKIKTQALFETINELFLHFWWKIRWVNKHRWKKKIDAPFSYYCNDFTKCVAKLLYYLIYLGIILSKGVCNSIWINRILQAINFFPSGDDIVYSSLLQLHNLKEKHCHIFMEILKHVLCTEIPLYISEPTAYLKSMILYDMLRNFIEDATAKAVVISTAAKIRPPSNIIPWLASININLDSDKNIMDQLFKEKSNYCSQKLFEAFLDPGLYCKHDSFSKVSENIKEQDKNKYNNEKDKLSSKIFNSQRVSYKVRKTSKKKSKLNRDPDKTFVNKGNGSDELSCANAVSFSDIKSQIKDTSRIKKISKRLKYFEEQNVSSTIENNFQKCKEKQKFRNVIKRKSKSSSSINLSVQRTKNHSVDVRNSNASELDEIKNLNSSNIDDQQIPDKHSKQCSSNVIKPSETFIIKSNFLDKHSVNITPVLHNPVLGDVNNNGIHAVSKEAINNCLSFDLDMSKEEDGIAQSTIKVQHNGDGNNNVNFKSNSNKTLRHNKRTKSHFSPQKRVKQRVADQALNIANMSYLTDQSSTSKQVKKPRKCKKSKEKNNTIRSDENLYIEQVSNTSDLNISNAKINEITYLNVLSNFLSNHGDCLSKENEFIDGSASGNSICTCNSDFNSYEIQQQNSELQKEFSSDEQIKQKPVLQNSDVADENFVTDKTTSSKPLKKFNFKINENPLTEDHLGIEIISEIGDIGVQMIGRDVNKKILLCDSSHLLPSQGNSTIQEKEFVEKNAFHTQNALVCNDDQCEFTHTSKNSIYHQTSEVSAHQDEESIDFILSSNEENQHKLNETSYAVFEDIRKAQNNLLDTNNQNNVLNNFDFQHHIRNKMPENNINSQNRNLNYTQLISDIYNGAKHETNIKHSQTDINPTSRNSSICFNSNNDFNFGLQNTNQEYLMTPTTSSTMEKSFTEYRGDSLLNISISKPDTLQNNNSSNCRSGDRVVTNINLISNRYGYDLNCVLHNNCKSKDAVLVNRASGIDSPKVTVTVSVDSRSEMDQQIKLLSRNIDCIEKSSQLTGTVNELNIPSDCERNMNPNSPKVKNKSNLSSKKDSHCNKTTIDSNSSPSYVISTPKNSFKKRYQTCSARKSKYLTQHCLENINECTSSEFDLNTEETINISVDKIEEKEKLSKRNTKEVDSDQNTGYRIYSDTSSDEGIEHSFNTNKETSSSFTPSQKNSMSFFKNCKRKLILAEPHLHSRKKTCGDESHKSSTRTASEKKNQTKRNDPLEKYANHTYNLRKRKPATSPTKYSCLL
ncbi:uncharacterized protein NPIL_451941 [Nephila pilipes]|uniref:Uncharacterized protein n=1 Tax=Nephila pilipes TaxID=299642 RepID=A0A8X6UER9_NEPPI|nr:uncharacterized protein NPIL_451941 [Nephila pilipes]